MESTQQLAPRSVTAGRAFTPPSARSCSRRVISGALLPRSQTFTALWRARHSEERYWARVSAQSVCARRNSGRCRMLIFEIARGVVAGIGGIEWLWQDDAHARAFGTGQADVWTRDRARAHGAVASLGSGFIPVLTGRENISRTSACSASRRKKSRRASTKSCDFCRDRLRARRAGAELQSGMVARLGFACA